LANVAGNRQSTSSCCGPFAQKRRRLEEIRALIGQLESAQAAGQYIGPALAEALAEEKRLRSWISQHEHRKD
jgi:hypothetical protein